MTTLECRAKRHSPALTRPATAQARVCPLESRADHMAVRAGGGAQSRDFEQASVARRQRYGGNAAPRRADARAANGSAATPAICACRGGDQVVATGRGHGGGRRPGVQVARGARVRRGAALHRRLCLRPRRHVGGRPPARGAARPRARDMRRVLPRGAAALMRLTCRGARATGPAEREPDTGGGTRRVHLVREEGRDVST